MPEKTKKQENGENAGSSPTICEDQEKDNWSRDQREKSYYYDDSYGYEVYNPDEDDDDDEVAETSDEGTKNSK